ncbi:fumarylacetoacetate hydrolase family protein [Christensenellaceae bacterium OttesenSCG-928-L17]|nr:fumarylacetoacetate hydrolase family protein [Christensenellaceae bacterium OttesenSCG-928-L17]
MKLCRVAVQGETFHAIFEKGMLYRLRRSPFEGIYKDDDSYRIDQARLLAPILPSKVVCVGKNYLDHAKELASEAPAEPLIFLKPSTSVIGPGDEIVCPPDCRRLDYEAELAVVIGKRCKNVPLGGYRDVVLGYTCLNDVTARDLQKKDGQWTRSKSFDTFCPIGPWIETQLDAFYVDVIARLNGEVKQKANTSIMIHNIDTLVYYASRIMTLLPGDIIATGTPAGIGPMQAGDTIEVEIPGIGVLCNRIAGA